MTSIRRILGVCAIVAAGAGGACAPEEKVVGVRGGLQNMPGAVSNIKVEKASGPAPTSAGAWSHMQARFDTEHPDLVIDPKNPMRAVSRDDPTTVVLLLYSPRYLITNLRDTIERGEWMLIQDQILSQMTKDEMRSMLQDPLTEVRTIARNRRSILALLETMPDADETPGLFLQQIGKNVFRLTAPGNGSLGLKFTRVDMTIENNQFKLVAIR